MDTLSSCSVSSLKVPLLLHSTSRQFTDHLRAARPNTSRHLPPRPHFSASTGIAKLPNSISNFNRPNPSGPCRNFSAPASKASSSGVSLNRPPSLHQRAATGYAAALAGAAGCDNSLEAVARDARRFTALVGGIITNPHIDDKEKGEAVKQAGEKGRFDRRLVALLRMLADKNRVGMVGEVLEEFQRIYRQLIGTTRVVLLSPGAEASTLGLVAGCRMQMKLKVRRPPLRVKNLATQGIYPGVAI